jgi:hypothetical protein
MHTIEVSRKSSPRRHDYILLQVRLKPELHARVRAAAACEELPVSIWIRRLCSAAIRAQSQRPSSPTN